MVDFQNSPISAILGVFTSCFLYERFLNDFLNPFSHVSVNFNHFGKAIMYIAFP